MWTDEDGLYVQRLGHGRMLEHDVDFEAVRETVVKRRHEHIVEVCQQEAEGTYVFKRHLSTYKARDSVQRSQVKPIPMLPIFSALWIFTRCSGLEHWRCKHS